TTLALNFMQQHNIAGSSLYINHVAGPAYRYYTQVHPGKHKRATLAGAHILSWNSDYESLARTIAEQPAAAPQWGIIFTANPADVLIQEDIFSRHFTPAGMLERDMVAAYIDQRHAQE